MGQFLRCSAYETVSFRWVMQEESIAEDLLHRLDLRDIWVNDFPMLMASEQVLRQRLERDVAAGLRQRDVIARSVQRLPMYQAMKTVKIDTSDLCVQQAAQQILWMLEKKQQPFFRGLVRSCLPEKRFLLICHVHRKFGYLVFFHLMCLDLGRIIKVKSI